MLTNLKNTVTKWIMDTTILFLMSTSWLRTEYPSPDVMTTNEDEASALAKFYKHLYLREGKKNKVYLDTLKKLTVGVGHLVLVKDKLKLGDVISDERVQEFLVKDAAKAWEAAKKQAAELGKTNWDFVIALGSVNFQLGTGWTKKFPTTYALLLRGMYKQAIANIKVSAWAKQTPVRTEDFIDAIEKAFA